MLPSQEANLKAEGAVLRALDLDSELAEAHASLGILRTRQWDWSDAEKEFRRASKLNPNYARAHSGYAICLVEMGRSDEALSEIKRAQSLNPLSLMINSTVGSILYFTRQYDEAIEQSFKTLDLDAHFAIASVCLGIAYEARGKYKEAVTAYRLARRGLGDIPELPALFARIHALSGRKDKALDAINRLTRLPRDRCVQSSFIALIYTALGRNDEAFQWLERAYTEHDDDLALLKVDPRWDGLRGDPRFMSLLERIGLANSNLTSSE